MGTFFFSPASDRVHLKSLARCVPFNIYFIECVMFVGRKGKKRDFLSTVNCKRKALRDSGREAIYSLMWVVIKTTCVKNLNHHPLLGNLFSPFLLLSVSVNRLIAKRTEKEFHETGWRSDKIKIPIDGLSMVIAPHLIDEKTRLKQQLNAKPFERAFVQRETKEKLHRNFLKRHSSPTFVDSARKRRQRALNFHFT